MFLKRLSEVTADDVNAVIKLEAAESIDFELKVELPAEKGKKDPYVTGGKLGEYAKDVLAAELIAFANTSGGTLIVGIGEEKATKKAIAPIYPLPNCRDLAARLHQALSARIEPRMPVFECEGVVTEQDGTSGVVVMRVLESYLAPHRSTQDYQSYIRRNDRAEPMSMIEIQEMTRRVARRLEDADKAFAESAERFFSWIPSTNQRTHPVRGVQGVHQQVGDKTLWQGLWAIRITARPLVPLPMQALPRQQWLSEIKLEPFTLIGRPGHLSCLDIEVVRTWQPRLRSVEREFKGDYTFAVDRIGYDGQIDRFFRSHYRRELPRLERYQLGISEMMWNFASVMRLVEIVRARSFRPTQTYAIEVEFMPSDPIMLIGYPGLVQRGGRDMPNERVLFPRYEIGDRDGFNEVLATFDADVWHIAGLDPDYTLAVTWPASPKL